MDAERVRIAIEGHVANVRMVRADKHNGLDWRMFVALNEAVDEVRGSDGVRAVVLSGEGPSFCAGLDIRSFAEGNGDLAGDGLERPEGERANLAQRVAYGWRELDVPVVAAVHGACLGGGLQIALGADIRIAAPDAQLSVMEIVHGLIPDMSITQTLPRLVRDDVARELVYTGRRVGAAEALELGLVTRVAEDPLAAAHEAAAAICERSPEAVKRAKYLLNEAASLSPREALELETTLQRELLGALPVPTQR
jgi:enoyl-CoA hydratase/carnithine racemase